MLLVQDRHFESHWIRGHYCSLLALTEEILPLRTTTIYGWIFPSNSFSDYFHNVVFGHLQQQAGRPDLSKWWICWGVKKRIHKKLTGSSQHYNWSCQRVSQPEDKIWTIPLNTWNTWLCQDADWMWVQGAMRQWGMEIKFRRQFLENKEETLWIPIPGQIVPRISLERINKGSFSMHCTWLWCDVRWRWEILNYRST